MADANRNAFNNPGQARESNNQNVQNQVNPNRSFDPIFSTENLKKFWVNFYYLGLDIIIYGLVYPMVLCLAFSYLTQKSTIHMPSLELVIISLLTFLFFAIQLKLLTHEHKFIQKFKSHSPDSFYSSILVTRDHLNIYILCLTLFSLVESIQKLSFLRSEQNNTFFSYLFGSTGQEMSYLTAGVPYIFWSIIKWLGIPVSSSLLNPTTPLIDIYLAEFALKMTVIVICVSKSVYFNSLYILELTMRQIADPLFEMINELDRINLQNQPQRLDANANVIPPVRRHLNTLALL